MADIIVALGSRNPVKVDGVRRVFHRLLGPIKLVSIHVDPPIGRQPLSLDELVRGAEYRGSIALDKCSRAIYGVGIEAGLIKIRDRYALAIQACYIESRDGGKSIGLSRGFPVPLCFYEKLRVNRGLELEDLVTKYYGVEGAGEDIGLIGILTRGEIDRLRLTMDAVETAIIPFLKWNREIYLRK